MLQGDKQSQQFQTYIRLVALQQTTIYLRLIQPSLNSWFTRVFHIPNLHQFQEEIEIQQRSREEINQSLARRRASKHFSTTNVM